MDENNFFENQEEGSYLHQQNLQEFSLCLRYQEQMQDYMEGFLEAAAAEIIRVHLENCIFCAKYLDEMQHLLQVVESMPFFEPEKDYAPMIMAVIEANRNGPPKPPWWKWRPKR